MPEEMAAASAEAGIDTSVDTSVDQNVDTSSTSDANVDSAQDTNVDQDQQQQSTGKKTRATLETLSSAKNDALKAIDPSLPGLIRDAVFAQKTLLREFPRGLREAVALRDAFESAGGETGLREQQEAIADYGRLEQWFEAGDKQFVDRLAEASPEAFSAMMPSGMEAWRQKDPEMYTHVMARVMMNTLGQNAIPTLNSVYKILAAIKDNDNAANAANGIAQLHDRLLGFDESAKNVPERKIDPQKQQLNQREQELSQREMRANLSPVRSEGLRQIESVTDSEMNRSYQWTETDSDVQQAVRNEVQHRIIKASKKDSAFMNGYQRLQEQGDWNGLKRHVTRFQARVLPNIVQQAARLFNVKPKAARTTTKTSTTTNTTAKVDQGWTKVSGPPNSKDVDRSKTTSDMVYDGKAILKNGKKVIWQ